MGLTENDVLYRVLHDYSSLPAAGGQEQLSIDNPHLVRRGRQFARRSG